MPPAARKTDQHKCPQRNPRPHVGGPVTHPCEPTVEIGGLPAARVSDMLQCVGDGEDAIVEGSQTVLIGRLQAARVSDKTAHGGVILEGCETVIIGDRPPPTIELAWMMGKPLAEDCSKASPPEDNQGDGPDDD